MRTLTTGNCVKTAIALAAAAFGMTATAELSSAAYVQKGLVHQWDGVDNAGLGSHNDAATTWTDLIGGAATEIYSGDTWTTNALKFSSGNSRFVIAPNGLGQIWTLQFVVTDNGATMIDSSDDKLWWKWNAALKFEWRNGTRPNLSKWTAGETFTVGSASAWYGVHQPSAGWTKIDSSIESKSHSVWAAIGHGNDGDTPSVGSKYYEIRIYDRTLTDEEIAINDAIDAARFFDKTNELDQACFVAVDDIPDQEFAAQPLTPAPTVRRLTSAGWVNLKAGDDYEVAYSNNFNLGTAYVTVTGLGDYSGKILNATFDIVLPESSPVTLVGDFSRKTVAAGWKINIPDIGVVDADGNPLDAADYEVSMTNCSATGVATVWAVVKNGPQAGQLAVRTLPLGVVPAEYQWVEWIGSTGAQWIDTGVVPVKDTVGVDIRFGQVKNESGKALFGQAWSWGDGFLFQFNPSFKFGNSQDVAGYAAGRDYRVTVEPVGIVTMDYGAGATTTSGYSYGTRANTTLALFGVNGGSYLSTVRIHRFTMTKSAETVCDLIPVRRLADDKPGFYDTVASAFRVNQGSGADFEYGADYAEFTVAKIAPQLYDGENPCTPVPTITDRATGAELSVDDFDLTYADNAGHGTASLTIAGKAASPYAGQSIVTTFPVGVIYRVDGYTRDVEGDGQSWDSPMSLSKALTDCGEYDHIYAKAGTYKTTAAIEIAKPITIKGGFKGTDDVTLAENPITILDTDRDTTFGSIVSVSTAIEGSENRFERLGFKNGYARGLYKSGASDLYVESCLFMTNGLANSGNGKGLYVGSASGATITIRDTTFRANRQETQRAANGSPNPALYLSGCKQAVVENCGFFGNGQLNVAPNVDQDSSGSLGNIFVKGAAIYTSVPLTVIGSRFSGNCVNIRKDSDSGGAIWFASGSSGSVVSNSYFYGNNNRSAWNQNGSTGGAIHLALGAASQTVKVFGTTFAYNLADGIKCAGGITIGKGTLYLDGCVFGGNMVNLSSEYGCNDLCVTENGIAHVKNTIFGQDAAHTHWCHVKGVLDLGEGVVYADPLFVTRPDTISPLVLKSGSYRYYNASLSTYDMLEKIDAHLMSVAGYRTNDDATYRTAEVHSPAIDGASATADVGSEPAPNAGRRNAGFWGGTDEASLSSTGVPTIADADVTAAFDANTYITVTAKVDGVTMYNATVKIETFATDPSVDAEAVAMDTSYLYGAQPGAVTTLVGTKVNKTAKVYVRVTAMVPGVANPTVIVKAFDVDGDLPDYYGHGGGANVVHVRGGAAEKCNGSNWEDAFPTLEEALAVVAADATKTEIWIMGTAVSTGQITTAFCPAAPTLTIRGGFTGPEDSAAARPAAGVAYVDGQTIYNSCILANTTGHDVTVERVAFRHQTLNGITKTGGGDLTVADCLFLTNSTATTTDKSWTGKGIAGRCIRVTSASGAHILVTNCVMRGNRQTSTGGTGGPGAALCFAGCASARVVDCLLHENGVAMWENGAGSSSGCKNGDSGSLGSAIYAEVPTVVERCRFSANCNNIRETWTSGGTIWFASGSAGSAVSNCLFCGNEDRGCWNYAGKIGGAIVVSLGAKAQAIDVYGSTFAYNLTDGQTAAAGMTVIQGTVNLVNCVFGGNIIPPSATEPSRDLRIRANGVVNASYTVFGSESSTAIQNAGTFNAGEGLIYQDPLFVTTPSVVSNYVRYSSSDYTYFYSKYVSALENLDAHLLSSAGYVTNGVPTEWLMTDGVNSPAIDAGTGDCSLEPDYNGGRRNAGFYGNTAEASKTAQSEIPLGFENITVTYPDGYSRPQVSFTVTGDPGCLVNVHAEVTIDGGTPLAYDLPGCAAGAVSSFLLPDYYVRGTALGIALSGSSSSGSVTGSSLDTTVTADRPVWYGHGGGEGVLHLWSGAPGRGDGGDWHNAFTQWKDLVAAYNATNGITEIWIIDALSPTAAPATLTVKEALAIRGGFANTDDSTEDRAPGAVSTLDARKLFGLVYLSNGAGKDVTVERIVFTRAADTGFVKSGAGNIAFTDCRFIANALDRSGDANNYKGRGARIRGTAGVTVAAFTNCTFEGNAQHNGGDYCFGWGGGMYCASLKCVTLDNCLFASNGVNLTSSGSANYGGDIALGSAIYLDSAPLVARNSRFIGNHGTCRNNGWYNGGAIRLCGASGGSALTNCVIAGCSDRAGWGGTDQLGSEGGAIVVTYSSADQTLDLSNCTIAYNLSDGLDCSGGLHIKTGTVTARNSIFYGNQRNKYSKDNGVGADVHVRSGSSFTADYCLFTENTVESVTAADGGTLAIDWENGGNFAGDPLFETTLAEYKAKIVTSGSYNYYSGSYAFFANLDVHLRSKAGYVLNDGTAGENTNDTSIAIDKGDENSLCDQEPDYNGQRINLGAYGNTTEASRSLAGQTKIDEFTVTYRDGWSRPWIAVRLGTESGEPGLSDVTIVCSTGGVDVVTKTLTGVAVGEPVTYAPSVYFDPGDLTVSVQVNTPGADVRMDSDTKPVEGTRPIWDGKGGGERVIHVRAGADGAGTGANWTDAYPTLAEGLKAISPSFDELWIAGDASATNASSDVSLAAAFAVRGGFDGHENAASERLAATGRSTLDFGGKVNGVRITTSAALTVERLAFTRATSRGFYKGGSGDFTIADCAFLNNTGASSIDGRGAYVCGNANPNTGTIALITNCVFEGNCVTGGTSAGSGTGLYAVNLKRLELVDTLFVSNGVAWSASSDVGRNYVRGAAMLAQSVRLAARNCRFLANRGACGGTYGGIVSVEANDTVNNGCRGTTFSHCLWLGNENLRGNATGDYAGALVITLGNAEDEATVENCTIALNLADATTGSAGLTMRKGVLTLKNSVIAGNFAGLASTAGCDLALAGGSANVTYTLFSSNDTASVSGSPTLGDGVIYGDPRLATKTATAAALIVKSNSLTRYAADTLDLVAAFNGHLRSRGGYRDEATGRIVIAPGTSPALDAGDPSADWSLEPDIDGCGYSGKRMNLGMYGNTPYASMSPLKGVILRIR